MTKLIMLKGLPASGKSTWAKEQVLASKGKTKRINKDLLRLMLDAGKYSKGNENNIIGTRDLLVEQYLLKGYDIIVDDTNFHPQHEQSLRTIVNNLNQGYDKPKYAFESIFFDTSLEECIKRDAKREDSVGKNVILQMYNQYLKPQPPEIDPKLPYTVIFDLDGTLCSLNGRNPYDASTCENDLVNGPVERMLTAHLAYPTSKMDHLILVSGREDKYREQTEKWLIRHIGSFEKLFMRKSGDNRADYIIKKEIYDEHIKNKYNVKFVVDDRPQVIRMWRSLGLFVFDVNQSGIEF